MPEEVEVEIVEAVPEAETPSSTPATASKRKSKMAAPPK